MNKSKNYRCIISFYLIYLTNMSSFLIMISTCTSSQPYVTSIPRLKTKGQTNLLDENWFPVYRFIKKMACSAAISYPPKKIFEFCQRKKTPALESFGFSDLDTYKETETSLSDTYSLVFPPYMYLCSTQCYKTAPEIVIYFTLFFTIELYLLCNH